MSLIADWYASLVEDCKSTWVEGIYSARQTLIETYHKIGERIVTDPEWQKHARGNGDTLSALSESTNIHDRNLRRAIQFYEMFPTMKQVQELPEGKNLSWNKIVTQYLPAKTDGRPQDEETAKTYKVIRTYYAVNWGVVLPVGTKLTYWEERGFYVTEPVNNICAAVSKWAVEAWHDYFQAEAQ